MVTLGAGDLVLCAGTLPRGTTFRERVEAAAAGGFAGISIWGRDYWAARSDALTDADMRALLNDYGLRVAELDPRGFRSGAMNELLADPERHR